MTRKDAMTTTAPEPDLVPIAPYTAGRWSLRAGAGIVLDVGTRSGVVTAIGPGGVTLGEMAALPPAGTSRDLDLPGLLAALLPGLVETARATWPHLVRDVDL